MNHEHRIEYMNVILRPLEQSDIEQLRKWRNDSKNTIYLRSIPYISSEMQEQWFKRYLDNEDEICFAIDENQILNRLVGSLSLYEFNDTSCFFGKILIGDLEAHGKDIGLNSTIAAVRVAFEQLRMNEVCLYVFINNVGALRIYEKAGFIVKDLHRTENGEQEYTMTVKRGEWRYAQHE